MEPTLATLQGDNNIRARQDAVSCIGDLPAEASLPSEKGIKDIREMSYL